MANLIGAGNATWMPLPLRDCAAIVQACIDQPVSPVRPAPRSAPVIVDPPEVTALLARVDARLAEHAEGLTALELRRALETSPEQLQAALAAGVRVQRLRRTGARGHMRYLRNA